MVISSVKCPFLDYKQIKGSEVFCKEIDPACNLANDNFMAITDISVSILLCDMHLLQVAEQSRKYRCHKEALLAQFMCTKAKTLEKNCHF